MMPRRAKSTARTLLLFALCLFVLSHGVAQTTTLPPSDRAVTNLGQTEWKYLGDGSDPTGAASLTFDDSSWQSVGLPYSSEQMNMYINLISGDGDGQLGANVVWYRKHLSFGPQYVGKKIQIEFEGVHTGMQVYVNGMLLPGSSAVAADSQATHVIGFIGALVDVTPFLHLDGTDNVIAVRAARNAAWFEDPGFSGASRFGQAMNGIFRPVYMYVTDPVYIPRNTYSGYNAGKWGTYVSTVSASSSSAIIDVQTNVMNEGSTDQDVFLTTEIVDASGNVVATAQSEATIPAGTAGPIPATQAPTFDQQLTVNNPTLWYPNNSIYGTPYMYKVFHIVSVNGAVIDSVQSPLGIRTLTWNQDFPLINGKPQYLWGGSGRYDYPALGSSVPEEQQWRDLRDLAAAGGNLYRPGHSSPSPEFLDAADAYGIMVLDPSGDGENAFSSSNAPQCTDNPNCDQFVLKQELHRDMIIRDRNHPSVLLWEADNGSTDEGLAHNLKQLSLQWDSVQQHAQGDRTPDPNNGDVMECDGAGCEIQNKLNVSDLEDKPNAGVEYWANFGTLRYDYDHELAFAVPFVDDWRQSKAANAFGVAQWYFADTPGENQNLTDGTPGSLARSLNESMTDFNRFPRLLYYIYKAAWTPFRNAAGTAQPVVALAHHWNRSGNITVNAFSNCPSVGLLINGVSAGPDQVPNPTDSNAFATVPSGATEDQLQATTSMPLQVHWNVTWQTGTVVAQCKDELGNVIATDQRTTAGPADHVELDVIPNVQKPDGSTFEWTANGSDAAFVEAKIVDKNGVVVPTADNTITFSVTGPATYVGGAQSLVTPNEPLSYHSPGDPELQAEGGLQKIALRTQFAAGAVTVTATSPGIGSGTATLNIQTVPAMAPTNSAPAILVQPANTSVTIGQPGHFAVTATGTGPLAFQWYKNGQPISGANNPTYDTPDTAQADDQSTFEVLVSNSFNGGSQVMSNTATLSVFAAAAPVITFNPAPQNVFVGQTATFTVVATGSPTLTYQWERNHQAIPGALSASYTTPLLTQANSGDVYTVVVTNPVKTATSTDALLTVNAAVPVVITRQPANVLTQPGQAATFTVVVSGSAPLQYVWQKTDLQSNVTIVGTNSPTLTIPFVQSSDQGTYQVSVSNSASATPVVSTPATLGLTPPGVNLSLGKLATASGSENDGLGPQNAIDGDQTTRWSSNFADNAWMQIDFGAPMTFNRIVLNWEAAYGSQYQIQYSNDLQNWNVAYNQTDGKGQTEDFSFPTVVARYVRLQGVQRATAYGYSLLEFSIYNQATCSNNFDTTPNQERFTVQSDTAVLDNLSGLQWDRQQYTLTGQSSQFTQPDAVQYCASRSMRLPTRDEALAISGASAASCAFPQGWSTWTSTFTDPNDAYWVSSTTGQATIGVANNLPGWAVCVSGTTASAPTITFPPASTTANVGQSAMFSVTATGTTGPAPATYTWLKNGTPVSITGLPGYATPAVADADNNASFAVTVTGGNGLSVTSDSQTPAVLTVTDNPTTGNGGTGGGGGTGTGTGNNNGNTNDSDTAIPGFGSGPVPTGPNLAHGATTTSSGDQGGFPAAQATDGDLTTRWGSTFVDPSWIQVDLGSAMPVGQVVLRWERAFGVAYQIQTSTDAQNWTTVFTQTNGQGGSENIAFQTVNARYVRMYGTQRSTQYGYSLWEFEVYGPVLPAVQKQPVSQPVVSGSQAQFSVVATCPNACSYQWYRAGTAIVGATNAAYTTSTLSATDNGSVFYVVVTDSVLKTSATSAQATLTVTEPVSNPSAPTVNLALGKPATASGDENDGLAPMYAVDGDLTTRWSSNFADNAWIEVDLGTPLMVDMVVLRWENAYGKAYVIEGSNDEQTWTPLYTQNNGLGGQETLTFPAATYRFIRMQGATRATAYGYSLYEFEIYGADLPMITTEPTSQPVTAGATATFAVVAGGTGPFTYQWQKNGTNITGATSPSYTTNALMTADTGSVFTAVVTNGSGSTDSLPATITVNSAAPTGQNLALNQLTKESGSENDGTLGSANAVDGNLTTRWSSNFADNAWLEIDLATSQNIGQVVLLWQDAYGKAYQIQTSNDEKTWTTVYTQSAGQGGTENITFQPTTARYIRMQGVTRATAYGYSLFEMQVYAPAGTTGATSDPGTGTGSGLPYTIYPGFIGVDLNNNTNGAWADNQVYVTVIGIDPNTQQYAYLTPDGTIVDLTLNDSTAPGHLTKNGQNYGNYSFTLAQSKLLKIPLLTSARAFISLGEPVYLLAQSTNGGTSVTGYASPNPQNATDPNLNVHYDWYEFNVNSNGIFINTTQVDQFGIPLTLDVWAQAAQLHQQVGITESVAQLDQEYASEVPAQFQPQTMSNLRILAPIHASMANGAYPTYFDDYVQGGWTSFSTQPLAITLAGRNFTGTTGGTRTLTFTEVNPAAANAGEVFVVSQPSTQDIVGCAGTMATGIPNATTPQQSDENTVELAIEDQICSAINRGVLLTPANWTNVSAYYSSTPSNSYSQFWHKHSIGGLAYGFSYDDQNNQSTTITTAQPEHMAFGIGW